MRNVTSVEAILIAFRPSMLAACAQQFPKSCTKCKKTYDSFKQFVAETKLLGRPRADRLPGPDPVGMMCFADCECKSTLGLVYEDVGRHDDFNQALEAESNLSGRSIDEVALELVLSLHDIALRQAPKRSKLPNTANAPDPMLLEIGAALVDMVKKGKLKIPPYSLVADRVQQIVRQKNFGLHEVTRLVTVDQALASAVLRTANSPEWRRDSVITSIPVAVTRIGADEIARLAFATSFAGYALSDGHLSRVRQHLWHRSVTTAVLARQLGKQRGLAPESCFAAALLHDIGSLIASVNLETVFAKRPFKAKSLDFWLRVIEHFHVELGMLAAKSWDLPQNIRECIAFHHEVTRAECVHADMVDVITASDYVAYLLEQKSHITSDDLAQSPYLQSERERSGLMKALAEIPRIISAFEPPDSSEPTRRWVATKSVQNPSSPQQMKIIISNAQKPLQKYDVVEASTASLKLRGIFALSEGFLVELKVHQDRGFVFWACVDTCVPDGSEHLLSLTPFALDDNQQKQWLTLVESTKPGATA